MPTPNDQAVIDYLKEGLDCEVEPQRPGERAGTIFVPKEDKLGHLHLAEDLVCEADRDDLMQRLMRDDIAGLLRKGERVKVTRQATEILPRG
jgi:hypothetical protein